MLRAPRGAGGGSRPGYVWLRTQRRQFTNAMMSIIFTWGQGGMIERSREGAGDKEGEEFCPTIVW